MERNQKHKILQTDITDNCGYKLFCKMEKISKDAFLHKQNY